MSEFDQLKNDVEKEAKEHPQQVKEGEQAVEKKLGLSQQDQSQQGQGDDAQQGQGNGGQDQSSGEQQ
jgi:hypothetical protein